MTRLKIKDKEYKIINNFSIKSSNNEVTFNNIKIDFSEGTAEDIPYKYQEVQIIQDGKVIFTGFLDTIKFSTLTTLNNNKEMTLTLLSPLKLATKRSVSLIGTNDINTAIRRILQPLIDDGFVIAEMNVPSGQITTSFVIETIENAMNSICSKRNLFWSIDANKNIYVNSVEWLFGRPVKRIITESYEKGLLQLQPTISNIDYANIINFKNVRLVYSTLRESSEFPICEAGKVLKKGDMVEFINPIILSEDMLRTKIAEDSDDNQIGTYYSIRLGIITNLGDLATAAFQITMNQGANYNKYENISTVNVTFNNDGDEEGDIVLQRDPFFNELITGFKWNGESDAMIDEIDSDTALRYTTMRFMYSKEIEALKGIISVSGQIENTIDYGEKWTTTKQLINYARSLMQQNTNVINEVTIQYDINPNVQVGDIITINRPNFFINGNFAVKTINYTYYNESRKNWTITLKNSDFISSYMDLFRSVEKQEPVNAIDTVILSEYIEEEIQEVHSVVESGVSNEN